MSNKLFFLLNVVSVIQLLNKSRDCLQNYLLLNLDTVKLYP